jgi:ribosomal-protein-alanine N-acetyltransferase
MPRMATVDIELAPAHRGEARAIAQMSRDFVEVGLGWEYGPRRIEGLIRDPDTVVLVARDGASPVGFAVMTFGDDRAHLVLAAVQPAYRRRGIARRLLAWLLESAAIAGIASIHVELRASNAPARRLYRALGFAETLRVPGYYRGREAAIRMMLMRRRPGATPTE